MSTVWASRKWNETSTVCIPDGTWTKPEAVNDGDLWKISKGTTREDRPFRNGQEHCFWETTRTLWVTETRV